MKKKLFNNWSNIAHRGLHDEIIPENSISSFKEALKNNYVIELDIHLIKDNNIVVFHDDNLKRMAGIDARIKENTYNELKKIKLLNSNEKIPLFKDVLKLINGQVPILIELKYDQKVGKLEKETISLLKNYNGEFYFQSFRLRSLIYLKRKMKCVIGLLIHSKKSKFYDLFTNYFFLKLFKIDFISYPLKKLPNKKIMKLYKKIPVLTWTIKKETQQKLASKYSDRVIFEQIKLVK